MPTFLGGQASPVPSKVDFHLTLKSLRGSSEPATLQRPPLFFFSARQAEGVLSPDEELLTAACAFPPSLSPSSSLSGSLCSLYLGSSPPSRRRSLEFPRPRPAISLFERPLHADFCVGSSQRATFSCPPRPSPPSDPMLHRLNCLVLLAALALLASPATAAAVDVEVVAERSLPETPQLSLARRFTSSFAQLRERKTSRVGLAGAQKRTLSDELLAMLKGEFLFYFRFFCGATFRTSFLVWPSQAWRERTLVSAAVFAPFPRWRHATFHFLPEPSRSQFY